MHQYCNLLSFLVSRQKLGPDCRSEWLWAAPTGAHSQPATCVQRGQVPQAARARAPPTCAHGRAALPAQAGRHRPRYQLRDLPHTSSLASTPWLARGRGWGYREGRGHRLPAAGRWRSLGTTPHTPLQLPFLPQKNGRVCPLLWDPTFLLESWFFQTQHLCSLQLFSK